MKRKDKLYYILFTVVIPSCPRHTIFLHIIIIMITLLCVLYMYTCNWCIIEAIYNIIYCIPSSGGSTASKTTSVQKSKYTISICTEIFYLLFLLFVVRRQWWYYNKNVVLRRARRRCADNICIVENKPLEQRWMYY